MTELSNLFVKLGLDKSNGLFITEEGLWKTETAFPNRVKRLIEKKIQPNAFFCFDNKPLILFFYNPADKKELHKAIWNFNECPIAIIVDNYSIEIFNGFSYLKENATLEKIGNSEKLNDFSYFELVTGRTWEQYSEQLGYKNRIDYHLLANIKVARDLLVNEHGLDKKIVNALIGKAIFVRYLIDRKVKMKFDGKLRTWSNDEFCDLLNSPKSIRDFFDYLEDNENGFNGDLFPLTSAEYKKITKDDFHVLKRLLKGEDINKGQLSLFELYDFSIIPIEFISNVYELFIGESNQQANGAYYTPLFLVDYILKETVDKQLANAKPGFSCKVLDPACGSGIFLVETLRKIIEKFISETGIETKSEKFKTAIRNLAKENIFGIDKDLSAVQVAVFSIYLTLLDYLEPPGIETFKFPNLIGSNFFNADFFDITSEYNQQLNEVEFNFILGNPPWMRGKGEKQIPLYVKYIANREKKEKKENSPSISIGNKEIAQAFILRSGDFASEKTKIGLIVTSKVLYNLQSVGFRKYFLHHFFLERIFELAPVRREVFDKSNDKAISPACVLFYQCANNKKTDTNLVEHIALKPSRFFTLFKIFTIHRADYKKIEQKKLIEFDWLFKILVYGSYLDFNLLKRLSDNYTSIYEFLANKKALVKQGIKRKDGARKINVEELIGWSFLDLNKKNLQQLHIKPVSEKWALKNVGYIYRENGKICKSIFTPPMLLIKETVNTSLESVSAVAGKKMLFTDKITSVKFRDANDENNYYILASLLNSTLFAYYVLNKSSTAGIMIEQQINDFERFSFPFKFSKELFVYAQKIEQLKQVVNTSTLIDQQKIALIASAEAKINEKIYELFGLNDEEKALVQYAKEVAIPISMKHSGLSNLFKPIEFNGAYLEEYISLFLGRFKKIFDTDKEKFIVEIWYTKQIVGLFFKKISISKYRSNITWVDKQECSSEFLTFVAKISSEKVTDKLFVQKDVRGFEISNDYFYIIKPNEKRLWHKAIGYLDVNEFADAILKAGRAGK